MWAWSKWSLWRFKPRLMYQKKLFDHIFNHVIIYTIEAFLFSWCAHCTLEWMMNPHMANMMPNPSFTCLFMFCECHNLLKTTYGLSWIWGITPSNKYTTKHKVIWKDRVNTREAMTRDYFIKYQNITYLNRKHKTKNWHLHQKPTIYIQT
jgi:hypothetical protein